MDGEKTVCVVCAWRATCNKKYSMTGGTSIRCVEFTRDVNLPIPEEDK